MGSPAKQSRLVDGQIGRMDTEVLLGRRFDTVSPLSEVDDVQILVQYLLLRPLLLQLIGQSRFAQLAVDGLVVGDVCVLYVLLGDGRPALHDLPTSDVGPRRPEDAQEVHALVYVEALVLDGDHRVAHDLGDLVCLESLPVLHAVQFRQESGASRNRRRCGWSAPSRALK